MKLSARYAMSALMLALPSLSALAGWDFRGEPNAWGTTRMIYVGEGRHFIRQSFSTTQDEFKVARDNGWVESYPSNNRFVVSGKTYDIIFVETSKTIHVDEVSSAEKWVFRGTSNGWGKTEMVRDGNQFVICQDFGSDNPRFKISNGNKSDWLENYPEQDFRVNANMSFLIRFTPATRGIQVTERSGSCANANINVDRSLIVHDEATLAATDFSLNRVITQLTDQMNLTQQAAFTTPAEFFARFWDTQNTAPGVVLGGPKCEPLFNGFLNACRNQQEGQQALDPVRFLNDYHLIALVNRFDKRDKIALRDCGEHRAIYSLRNGPGRNFIIFEARIPNPTPGQLSGCSPLMNAWKNLSTTDSASARAAALSNFYFNGFPSQNIRAVFDWRNFANGQGQIRTNQFMAFGPWVLKEFNTAIEGGLSVIKPATVKAAPFGPLFSASRNDSLAQNFRTQFINNVGTLLADDLSAIDLLVSDNAHNNGHSHASGDAMFDNDYFLHAASNSAFLASLQNKLNQLGNTLTPEQVLRRATAMSCAGCHQPTAFSLFNSNSVGPNQRWPDTQGFVHVSEFAVNGQFPLSPALTQLFLPARKRDFEAAIVQLSSN